MQNQGHSPCFDFCPDTYRPRLPRPSVRPSVRPRPSASVRVRPRRPRRPRPSVRTSVRPSVRPSVRTGLTQCCDKNIHM